VSVRERYPGLLQAHSSVVEEAARRMRARRLGRPTGDEAKRSSGLLHPEGPPDLPITELQEEGHINGTQASLLTRAAFELSMQEEAQNG
jgi:hypothetical protein